LGVSTLDFDKNQLAITPDNIVMGTLDHVRQLLNEEPNTDSIGPFKSTGANARTTKTHSLVYFPFETLEPLLGTDLVAHQVFELIMSAIIDAGLEDTCAELINFLTMALLTPSAHRAEHYTLQDQAGKAGYVPGPEAISYHQEDVLYRDLYVLKVTSAPPLASDPALLDVAQGLRGMVAEARAKHHDRLESRDEYQEKIRGDHGSSPATVYVFQQAVDAAYATQGMPTFKATPSQVMAFKNFWFAGSSYFDIGSGFLSFSITPADGNSDAARALLAADRGRDDTFYLGADQESGVIAPGKVGRLWNVNGYIPISGTKARTQLRSASGLFGALIGNGHPAVLAFGRFLQMYERIHTRLVTDLDHAHGRRLVPCMINLHVQLACRNWMVVQLDVNERERIDAPDVCHGLTMLEVKNNLMWIPSVTNVPNFLALWVQPHASVTTVVAISRIPASELAAEAGATGATPSPPRRDAGPQVLNPNRHARFVGSTPMARLIHP
jgi:hypothetical protein